MGRKFFHITDKRHLPSIMRKGLLPKAYPGDREKGKGIWFWDNLEVALGNCDPLLGFEVILEVDVPSNLPIGRRWNEGNDVFEYAVHGKIPPNNVKELARARLPGALE